MATYLIINVTLYFSIIGCFETSSARLPFFTTSSSIFLKSDTPKLILFLLRFSLLPITIAFGKFPGKKQNFRKYFCPGIRCSPFSRRLTNSSGNTHVGFFGRVQKLPLRLLFLLLLQDDEWFSHFYSLPFSSSLSSVFWTDSYINSIKRKVDKGGGGWSAVWEVINIFLRKMRSIFGIFREKSLP